MFRFANLGEFSKVYLAHASPRDHHASPIFADLSGLCPVLIQVASTEVLLDDSRGVYSRLLETGGESTLEVYADVIHAWQMCDGIVPEARVALGNAVAFISSKVSTDQMVAALTEVQ
jgi:acetyl esterase/lipase